ncbi:hypothetical protein BWR18_20835 (plasmid) [Tateyamaria omphalii]|uniref:GspL periplasmic domain-containing protein n=1 Tax=Tateyamaria omphalii TaxID=299262 RepID=A0A1P8N1W2_9RHOB|nr:hypothetical protein BWR18_20835 [Tateyamaria omphalii]
MLPIELPTKLRGQNRENVAHRQMRDKFGIDPETVDLRPFFGTKGSEEWSRVLVTDKALISVWRDAIDEDALAILPDYLTLPTAPDVWTVAANAQGVSVRLGPDDGFGAHADLGAILLNDALEACDRRPKALLRIGEPIPAIDAIASEHGIGVETDAGSVGAKALSHGEVACDLRRDPQLARARMTARILPWRWPMAFGLVAAIVWAAAEWIVTDRIAKETQAIRAQTMAIVQDHFVDGAPVVDVRVQVGRVLASAQAQAHSEGDRPNPLSLFGQTAIVLNAASARAETASFDTAEGFRVVAILDNFAAVEDLVADLEQAGISVDLQDTRANDAGVQATLALSTSNGATEGDNQ